jgi:hypothetical protein
MPAELDPDATLVCAMINRRLADRDLIAHLAAVNRLQAEIIRRLLAEDLEDGDDG